jgi:hypothetical protein
LMEGAEGFRFMYFHLWSFGIRVLLSFTVFLTCFWKVCVGSVATVWNLLSLRKFSILFSYWGVGRITMELPLSALVTVALFSFSFVWIDLISFVSGCVRWGGVCCFSLSMRSATSFL